MDALTEEALRPLYYLVGSVVLTQLITAAFAFIKWLGARTVSREDKDKEELKALLKEHTDRFSGLEDRYAKRAETKQLEDKYDELETTLASLDRTVNNIQMEMKQMLSTVDTTRGVVSEIKGSMDVRFEKQGEFYRTNVKEITAALTKQTEEIEFKLRQDMTRAIHDAAELSKNSRRRKPR